MNVEIKITDEPVFEDVGFRGEVRENGSITFVSEGDNRKKIFNDILNEIKRIMKVQTQ